MKGGDILDASKIIEFLKSSDVTQEIWEEVADLIMNADGDEIEALTKALED